MGERETTVSRSPSRLEGGARAWLRDGSVVPVTTATHEAVGVELPPTTKVEARASAPRLAFPLLSGERGEVGHPFPSLLLPDFLEHLYTITALRPEGH